MPDDEGRAGPLTCARCGGPIPVGRGEGYLIDIRAVADPTPPAFSAEDLQADTEREISRLLASLRGQSERQLLDQVYGRRLFCLCNACYARWIDDPFGG
jgi:hypothetical protein